MSTSTPTTVVVAAPAPSSSSSSVVETATSPLDTLDLLKHVLSFVGEFQYRFVAGVNRHFQEAYLEVFPGEKWTAVNASTEAFARICCSELNDTNSSCTRAALCTSAVLHGNLPALQHLRAVNCPWDERTCASAAGNGHLHILQWCRENGCRWNRYACASAAGNGHLHILQWCRENGCPWDERTLIKARAYGHWNVVQWCQENGL